MKKRIESAVSGRVQMVMYRDFIKRSARKLGLVGTVKNNPDGTVSIVAEGEEEALRELLERARRGSLLSRVDAVETRFAEPTESFSRFTIVY